MTDERARPERTLPLAQKNSAEFWRHRAVLLTGHTGFKGAWMSLWLRSLGAQVAGFALAPASNPNLWSLINDGSHSVIGFHRHDLVGSADQKTAQGPGPGPEIHHPLDPLGQIPVHHLLGGAWAVPLVCRRHGPEAARALGLLLGRELLESHRSLLVVIGHVPNL